MERLIFMRMSETISKHIPAEQVCFDVQGHLLQEFLARTLHKEDSYQVKLNLNYNVDMRAVYPLLARFDL